MQSKGPRGWEALGSGEGRGPDPEAAAVRDLARLSGGLPAGTYRVIVARTGYRSGPELTLDEAGEVIDADDQPGFLVSTLTPAELSSSGPFSR